MNSECVAISFSNIQYQYKLPSFFILTSIKKESIDRIPKFLPIEQNQEALSIQDILILNEFKYKLAEYYPLLTDCKIIDFQYDSEQSKDRLFITYRGYYRLIDDYLAKGNTIDVCYVRAPLDKKDIEITEDDFFNSFNSKFYNFDIEFMNCENSNGFLDLSRSIVNDHFKQIKYKEIIPLNILLNKHKEDVYQIIQHGWNRVSVADYCNNYIGNSFLIILNNNEYKRYEIEPGVNVNFLLINKFCIGPHKNMDEYLEPCLLKNKRKPFGKNMLKRGERCSKCDKENSISFLYKKKKYSIDKIDDKIYGNIVLADYVIYISFYGPVIKVGRTLFSRSVNRLIEESAFDAITFYPIAGLQLATHLEKKMYSYLLENLGSELNIKEGVDVKDKLLGIKHFNNNRENMNKIFNLLSESNDPDIKLLLNINIKKINLKQNYYLYNDFYYDDNQTLELKYINGKINGIIGGLVIINDEIFDINKLIGYVGVSYND